MKFTKKIAAFIATAVAVSSMVIPVAAEVPAGRVILGIGDANWALSIWGASDDKQNYEEIGNYIDVNANGTYTITLDVSDGYTNEDWIDDDTGDLLNLTTANGIGAAGIQATGDCFANAIFNVEKVTLDDVELTLTGSSYTNAENDGWRTNIYNQWGAFKAENDRTLDAATATATLISVDSIAEWSKMTVTFTVSGMEETSGDDDDDTTADDDDDTADDDDDTADDDDDTTADDDDDSKDSPDTGVEGIAVVAGIAIVAAGAVIAFRKRK